MHDEAGGSILLRNVSAILQASWCHNPKTTIWMKHMQIHYHVVCVWNILFWIAHF